MNIADIQTRAFSFLQGTFGRGPTSGTFMNRLVRGIASFDDKGRYVQSSKERAIADQPKRSVQEALAPGKSDNQASKADRLAFLAFRGLP